MYIFFLDVIRMLEMQIVQSVHATLQSPIGTGNFAGHPPSPWFSGGLVLLLVPIFGQKLRREIQPDVASGSILIVHFEYE
jgi:hypothetical protein